MKYRNLINNLLLAAILILSPFVFNRINTKNENLLTFLDIGQGDATLICTENNSCGLIDTGKKEIIVDKIRKHTNKELAFILITHADTDHYGQTQKILENIGTNTLFIGNTLKAENIIEFAQTSNTPTYELREDNDFTFGDFNLDILWPDSNIDLNSIESNDSSTSIIIRIGEIEVFLAGDLSSKYEELLQDKFSITNIDILKISHHGSKNSSSFEYLYKTNPKLAIIPVGKNSYGHPSNQVLEHLNKLNIKFLRTDREGDVNIRVKKENLEINTENTKNSYIILN